MPRPSILITGITGFVGSHLAEYILNSHPEFDVVGFARWRSPKDNIIHLGDSIHIEHGDLIDFSSIIPVLKKHRPEFIFHLAAQSYVDFSFQSPITTLNSNIIGTANLLEAVKELKNNSGYDPIVHVCSSSEVYGQVREDETPIKETNPLRPASPYAVSKVGQDMLAFQYWLSWKIKTIRSRMFTHTGPRRGEVFALSNFARQVAAIEADRQEPIVRVGNLDSVRTWMDVRDAVRAYWMMVEKCSPGEVYNIGGVETMTIGEMLKKLMNFSTRKNIKVEVDPVRFRPSDVTLQIPSVEKFKRATGWEPKIPFDKTVLDTLNYWRDFFSRQK